MKQKLIVTLWKAQIDHISSTQNVCCRMLYNNEQKNSKSTSKANNLAWKETFVFGLAKKESDLKLQFINLRQGETIHFIKGQVAESMSFGKSLIPIVMQSSKGSLPCKVDIIDQQSKSIGKIFIQYEVIRTEVAYIVERQMDYFYILKLSNFRINFVRNLKKVPHFFLKLNVEDRSYKEDFPFDEHSDSFSYNYPIKLYLKKQMELEIQIITKDYKDKDFKRNNPHQSSFTQSIVSQKKSQRSSIGKKEKNFLELGPEKISANLDLVFKGDVKYMKKLALTVPFKFQKRQIGSIEFQIQTFFRTKQELAEIEEQRKALNNPEKDLKTIDRKKNVAVQQKNGQIIINSILGRLELFNEEIIQHKNISISIKLGKQHQTSAVLESPGKELIFIDTFIFKRTWQEAMKFTIEVHNQNDQKMPTFFSEVSLRELFDLGRYISKKIKLRDENKNYCGELVLDMLYKEVEEKKIIVVKDTKSTKDQQSVVEIEEVKSRVKREQIQERIKKRSEEKQKTKELSSLSALAVLRENQIILPPLKNRYQTLSPSSKRSKGANVFNTNGGIKFTKSRRFSDKQEASFESYMFVRDSDFDVKKNKRGTSIGYGEKYDFTKDYEKSPGVGRYQINSVWDKYKV